MHTLLKLIAFTIGLTHQLYYNGYSQPTRSSKYLLQIEQLKYLKTHHRHVKGIENPSDIGTRGISIEGLKESVWLNGPAWLQTDEENWPRPWNQTTQEVEDVQITIHATAEMKSEQFFDWQRYSNFNRIRNVIAY